MTDTALNIDDSSVEAFLDDRGPDFAGHVRKMERAESWAVDSARRATPSPGSGSISAPQLSDLLGRLRESLESYAQAGVAPPSDALVSVLAHLRSSRAMMLFSWCDQAWPGQGLEYVEQALNKADRDEACFLLLDRLQNLDRAMLLSKIFSRRSMRDALEAMTSAQDVLETF